MSKEHLTYFKVENFKRFDSLELTDIGQFNLIVGDNNVGKTSVLEALLFDDDRKKCLLNLHKTLFMKGLNIRPKMIYGTKGEVSEVLYPDENFLRYIFKKLDKVLIFSIKIVDERDRGSFINISMGKPPENHVDPMDSDFDDVSFTGKTPDNRYIEFYHSGLYDFPIQEHPEYGEFGGEEIIGGTVIAGLYEHLFSQNIDQWYLPLISPHFPEVTIYQNPILSKLT
ncbi:MAG: AAA family ATPase [Lewinellaceae bacterium]|nr:AAA family ATPase [Lewinellaceae bacterium]